MSQTTGGNNLDHTVTNEAVNQRIRYLIGMHGPLLESLVGRNVNGLTIPPGGQFGSHMAWCMLDRQRAGQY